MKFFMLLFSHGYNVFPGGTNAFMFYTFCCACLCSTVGCWHSTNIPFKSENKWNKADKWMTVVCLMFHNFLKSTRTQQKQSCIQYHSQWHWDIIQDQDMSKWVHQCKERHRGQTMPGGFKSKL